MSQSISGTVDGLYAAAQTVYATAVSDDGAPVLVSYGLPGSDQPQAIVAVGVEVRAPETRPTMGAGRSREVTAEIDCVVSVYAPGDESAQQVANAKAWDLLALLSTYLRTRPNETLGGACRDSWVSSSTLVPSVAYEQYAEADAPSAVGRTADITVTVTASIRN